MPTRNPALLQLEYFKTQWLVLHVFDDPERDHDWGIGASMDLAASDEVGDPVVAQPPSVRASPVVSHIFSLRRGID